MCKEQRLSTSSAVLFNPHCLDEETEIQVICPRYAMELKKASLTLSTMLHWLV